MKTISIHDAKTNLSKYIAAAKKGEKVYIGGFGKPEVALVKISQEEHNSLHQRLFSVGKGKLTAQSDTFLNSTDQAIASLMLDD
jgi:antitoxin (DNA-binding transcriptional repressor) of toxin-antitoxin stability system